MRRASRKWSAAELATAEVEVGLRPPDDPDVPMFKAPLGDDGMIDPATLGERLSVLASALAVMMGIGGLVGALCDDPADFNHHAPDVMLTHGVWWWVWVGCWGPFVVAAIGGLLFAVTAFLQWLVTGR